MHMLAARGRWLRVLLPLMMSSLRAPAGAGAEKERFSNEVFERLKRTLHTLPKAEADRAVWDVLPAAREPLPGSPVEHLVVLFMENRGFDHIFGCMLSGRPGVDGVPAGGLQLPVNSKTGPDANKSFVNISCGTADYVCGAPPRPGHPGGGPEFDPWLSHFCGDQYGRQMHACGLQWLVFPQLSSS